MKKCLALFALLLLAFNSNLTFAGNDDRSLVHKGDRAFKKAHLGDALGYYLKALVINPKDCYASFQAGAIYYLTDSSRIKSVPYFENTIKYATANEDTIIDAYYYLGNCYILQKNYSQAIISFQKYLDHLVDDKTDRTIIKEVSHNIEICKSAPSLVQRPPDSASYFINGKYQPLYFKNLGSLINSPYPEYSQVLLDRDSTIVFTSRRPTSQKGKRDFPTGYYYEDIFMSHKDNTGQWLAPSLFSNLIHFSPHKLNLASVSLSPDGKTLFIYHKGKIYQSTRNGSGWSDPVRIGKNVKQIKKYMPTVFESYDSKKLFLVSDRKGGYGGKDIYMCTYDNGVWSDPKNLGADINTPYDEDAPFLMPDNKTLFFSSTGHKGLGGYDVFKSVYENGKWSTPQNVGAPVNSTADDIFFTYDTATKKGYLSSSRINEGYGDMDIYSFSFTCDNIKSTVLQGKIVSTTSPKGIPSASITVTDISSHNPLNASSDDAGKFSFELKPDTKYTLSVKATGFINSSATFTTPHQCDAYNLYQVIGMSYIGNDSLHKGQSISIKNAFYRTASTEFKSAKNDADVSGLASSYNEQGDIWLKDTTVTMNYTQAQIDSLNPHAVKAVTQVATNVTPSKFPNVQFELNSSVIAENYHATLDSIAKIMHGNTKIKLQVLGYADNTGAEALNKRLSQSRANAVTQYLTKKGVKSSNIRAEGKGTANPIAPNDGSRNYLNRRVELIVIQ